MARILKLPKAVQEAADKADAYLKGPAPTEKTETPPAEVVATVEPSPQPEVKPVEDIPPAPQPTPVVDKTQTVEYWEHRLKTLQGIHEADKSRSRSETQTLKDELKKLTDKLSETIKAVPVEYDIRKYFSEQEIETQGEDNIRALLRAAAKLTREQTAQAVEKEVAEKVEPLKEKLERTEKAESDRRVTDFWTYLNREVPNWDAINKDLKFHEWLKEGVPFTNHTRQDALSDAEKTLDSGRVVTIFKAYVDSNAKAQAAVEQKLERKVVPDSIPSASIPSRDIIAVSRAQVNEHYRLLAIARNNPDRYPGGASAAEAMEARINAAYRAGKIT